MDPLLIPAGVLSLPFPFSRGPPPRPPPDTTRANEGVRVGVEYQPGVRPGLVVLPGAGLDSVRAIVRRDLDYSDRFEMIALAAPPAGPARPTGSDGSGINYGIYKALGAQYGVEIAE